MIVHRDVKPANFLVDEYWRVVVADFGLSDQLLLGSSTRDEKGHFKGTVLYSSPEVCPSFMHCLITPQRILLKLLSTKKVISIRWPLLFGLRLLADILMKNSPT